MNKYTSLENTIKQLSGAHRPGSRDFESIESTIRNMMRPAAPKRDDEELEDAHRAHSNRAQIKHKIIDNP